MGQSPVQRGVGIAVVAAVVTVVAAVDVAFWVVSAVGIVAGVHIGSDGGRLGERCPGMVWGGRW